MKKRIALLFLMGILILSLIVSCGSANKMSQSTSYDSAAEESAGSKNEERARGDAGSPEMERTIASAIAHRKVIKNCEMRVRVEDLKKAVDKITKKTEQLGGLVSEASIHANNGSNLRGTAAQSAEMTLRVPSNTYREIVDYIKNIVVEPEYIREYTDDVTEEYIDLEARIRVLEAEEKSLIDILEKAEKVEDMIRIREHLLQVRKERESLQGRINYLEDRVSYSTVRVSLYQPSASESKVQTTGLRGTWEKAVKAMIKSVNYMLAALEKSIIITFAALPVIIPLGIIAAVIIYIKKRKTKRTE